MSDPIELATLKAGADPSVKAKSAGLSRRRILKRAIVASAGVALSASPVLATSDQPRPTAAATQATKRTAARYTQCCYARYELQDVERFRL